MKIRVIFLLINDLLQQDQEEVDRQLKVIEEKLKRKDEAKQQRILEKIEEVKHHTELVNIKVTAVKEVDNTSKNELIQKDLEKMLKTVKNRVSCNSCLLILYPGREVKARSTLCKSKESKEN